MSPIPIETLVKEKIPIISHAMLVGNKAKFLSMLLTLKVMALACGPLAPYPPTQAPELGGRGGGCRGLAPGSTFFLSTRGWGSGMTREEEGAW